MVADIRRVVEARPLQPFEIHMADGRSFTVLHPDYFWVVPKGRRIAVTQNDGSYDILPGLLIAGWHAAKGNGPGE